jgi:asparagine synthase (glutamine-hydrolysing)
MKNIVGQILLRKAEIASHRYNPTGFDYTRREVILEGPLRYQSDDGIITVRGSPRHGDEVSEPDVLAQRILAAYIDRGRGILSELRGSFALVIALPKLGRALIAIDRIGVERLTWATIPEGLAVGSSALEVARVVSPTPRLDPQSIHDFMLAHMVPSPGTVFSDVQKLLPGTAVEFRNESIELFRYWEPDFSRPTSTDVAQLRGLVLPTLEKAIETTRPDESTGAFLSGGLDSSTITGLLARLQESESSAFSVGFGEADFDELSYARTAVKHFGCRHSEYQVTADDIVETIPQIANAYDEPFGNSSAVPTLACALLARRHGITHLLAGDGGDEIFGGNERYTRQKVFEWYTRLPASIRRYCLEPLAEVLDPESSPFPLRKFASYVGQARVPLPERFETWNLIYRANLAEMYDPEFLKVINPRHMIEEMSKVWSSCPSKDLLDRMLWYDWKFTLADNDLRKVSRMCELAGVKVSYPMLDERVVELSLKVPSEAKINGNDLRSFFKQSVSGFLPRKIISKSKHGFGLPFGKWLKEHSDLQDVVYGSLDSLGGRGIFNAAFLQRIRAEHRDGHASYYGYAIWDLVMLEQWLSINDHRW